MKSWLIWLGGALLGLALYILGNPGRALKRVESQRDAAKQSDIDGNLVKAEKLAKKAEKHRLSAKSAHDRTVAKLEERSDLDPDMDDLLSGWQSKRVRDRSS